MNASDPELNARQKVLNETMRKNAIIMDNLRKEAKRDLAKYDDEVLLTNCTYQRARADYNEARVEYNNNLFKEQRRQINADFDKLWAEFQHFTVDHKKYQLATKELENEVTRLRYQRGKVFR